MESSSQAYLCPSCNRFIGPVGTCPFCDADARRPLSLRVLRGACVLLAVAGATFLLLMVRNRDLPLVTAAEITPVMNFACVRVAGVVEREPYVSRRGGRVDYLSFLVNDGSGCVRVAAYGETARRLIDADGLPQKGASVDVSGSLRAGANGKIRLQLQAVGQLKIGNP